MRTIFLASGAGPGQQAISDPISGSHHVSRSDNFYLNFDDEPIVDEPLSFLHQLPDVDMDEVEILITKKRH